MYDKTIKHTLIQVSKRLISVEEANEIIQEILEQVRSNGNTYLPSSPTNPLSPSIQMPYVEVTYKGTEII